MRLGRDEVHPVTADAELAPDQTPAEVEEPVDTEAVETPANPETTEAEAVVTVETADAEAVEAVETPTDPETAEAETAEAETAEAETVAAEAAPAAPAHPGLVTPARMPVPGPPRSRLVPAAPTRVAEAWGKVDANGTVSVREGDTWRVVGEYPDGTPEEALAYFGRKYADLAGEVSLLEARHHGGAAATGLRSAALALQAKVDGAAAVGDLAGLGTRLATLVDALTAASAAETVAAREAVDEALAGRTALVEKAEALAARDPHNVQWKQASAEMSALFDEWQSQQQNGPRLPKGPAQQLWKRFRTARATVDRQRREFYSELDEVHKTARDLKSRLVEKAEALATKGEDGIGTYRELLDQWKAAGRAGKKADDALWARFKAAGDALYGARGQREAAEAEESQEKIAAKRALLDEASAVPNERDLAKARALLTSVQRRWDDIGRIFPREQERALDDELRKVEQSVRGREDIDWKRNNPETKARANDMTRQLTDAIAKLEGDLEAAEKSGDARAVARAREALDARRGWLRALSN
jgi:hypothetical protein